VKSRLVTIAALLAISSTTVHADPVVEKKRTTRLLALLGGSLLYATSELAVKDQLSPDHCRWCEPPNVDATVRDKLVWEDTALARNLSNVSGYAAAPVVAAGLLVIASTDVREDRVRTLVDDAIPIAESVVYTQLVTQIVKFSVGRQRPYAHFTTGFTPGNEDNLSFISGHSSLAFSIAVSSGMVAHRRGYELEPVIWVSGLSLAALTAYLRIAADRHYLTDVVAGSVVGAAGGYLIPRITGSLPDRVVIVPSRNGLSVVGSF
jgi:membrane-associated phospholipid phosphatase